MRETKQKPTTEFEKFDKVMDGLLAVPYKELQEKIEEEKARKAKRKKDESKPRRNNSTRRQ